MASEAEQVLAVFRAAGGPLTAADVFVAGDVESCGRRRIMPTPVGLDLATVEAACADLAALGTLAGQASGNPATTSYWLA